MTKRVRQREIERIIMTERVTNRERVIQREREIMTQRECEIEIMTHRKS